MTDHPSTPVTVLGLGAMGRALAEAFLAAGHRTTVWNRTPEKAAPLVSAGAEHASTVAEAVAASPLVISCLTTFEDTIEVLFPAAEPIAGKALVTLNSGSPAGARQLADRAREWGARFLAGAIKDVPTAVGGATTLLYYGGDAAVFDEFAPTLRVLGGDTVHLGPEPDLAALYEMAVGGTLLPTLMAFFEGAVAVRSRGFEAASMVRFTAQWLEMITSLLPMLADEIDRGDFSQPVATIDLFLAGAESDRDAGREAGLDTTWREPQYALLRRAAEAGHGQASVSALTRVLGVRDRDRVH